jgi:5'(3')-deoxyribonucleotidase
MGNNKRVIMWDVDGVLNPLYLYWLNMYGIDNGVPIDVEKCTSWELAENGYPESIYEYMDQPGFYKYAPPIPYAIDCVRRLEETGDFQQIIYTACDNNPGAYHDKATWINYHLPFLPNKNKIIGGNWKHYFKADVYVDDSPRNQLAIKNQWPEAKVISPRWPYNDCNASKIDLLAQDYRDPESAYLEIEEYIRSQV